MGEHADEPRPAPDAEAAPPKFMKTIQGWLIGLSGIVVTVVGLRAAVLQLMPDKDPPATEVAQVAAEPVTTEEESSPETATDAAAEEPLPLNYEIPGGTLAFNGHAWIESNAEGSSTFKEVSRGTDGMTVAFDEDRNMYLRWPDQGGKVEWSLPDPLDWTELYYAKAVTAG